MTDAEIGALRFTNPDEWARKVDPSYAARCRRLRAVEPPATALTASAPAAPLEPGITRQYFKSVLAPVLRAIGHMMKKNNDSLEARIAALEARPQLQYRGVWRDGQEHSPGHFTTHDGSLWHCNCATFSKPGTDGSWTLAVKRGRDTPDPRYTVR